MNARHPIVWRSSAVRFALAALPLWFTVAVLVFNTPWPIKLIVGAVFAWSVVAPARALLAVAFLAPMGRFIGVALDLRTFRVTEAIIVAFLAGWLIRPRRDPEGPRMPRALGWLAGLVVGASIVAQAWKIAQFPGALGDTLQILYQAYYIIPDRIGFGAGARLLEGLGLLAATMMVFRARPRTAVTLPAAMGAAAFVAACSSLLLVKGIALGPILADSVRTAPRVSAHVGDVNAAASYFGMMLIVAIGMAAWRRRTASLVWIVCAAALAAALWLTGSRTGLAATAIIGAAAAAYGLASRWSRAARTAALIVVMIAAIGAGAIRAWTLRHDAGTDFRRDFNATSLRMIAARPVIGVGIGQYYDTSPLFLSRFLGWSYGLENAHNFFLQLAAELGILGAAPLLALLAMTVVRGAQAILARPDDMRLLGCEAAVTALLVTCLTGHPLLIDEVAFPFWMLAGLLLALSGSAIEDGHRAEGRPALSPRAVVALCAAVLIVYVGVVRRPIAPSQSVDVTGLEPWETAADGSRYRWTLDYASVFVPRSATRVHIPVRLPVDLPQIAPIGVQVKAAGLDRGRTVVGASWATLDIELPPLDTRQAYRRIDLKVDRTWQPAIYIPGSRDLRSVGVQVGEVKTFYED